MSNWAANSKLLEEEGRGRVGMHVQSQNPILHLRPVTAELSSNSSDTHFEC